MGYHVVRIECPICGNLECVQCEYDPPEPRSEYHPGSPLEVYVLDDIIDCKRCHKIIDPFYVQEQAEKKMDDWYYNELPEQRALDKAGL